MVLFDSHVTYVGGSDRDREEAGIEGKVGLKGGLDSESESEHPSLRQLCHVRAETQVVDLREGCGSGGGSFNSNTFEFTFLCSPAGVSRSGQVPGT